MSDYRFYRLDARGHIETAEWIEASNDAEAIEFACAKQLVHGCELWDRNRLVSVIPGALDASAG